jgi:hypothetical protein
MVAVKAIPKNQGNEFPRTEAARHGHKPFSVGLRAHHAKKAARIGRTITNMPVDENDRQKSCLEAAAKHESMLATERLSRFQPP